MKTSTEMDTEQIRRFRLFRDFPPSTLEGLLEECREIRLRDREILISEGSDDRNMYVVLSGQMFVHKLDRRIDVAGPGDHVGEMLLIDSRHRSATVRANGQVSLLEIGEEAFRKYILAEPLALSSMLGTFCERTRKLLDVVAGDFQQINMFVHDMRNILFGLEMPRYLIESQLERFKGTEEGHKPRQGLDDIRTALKRLIAIQSDLIVLLERSLAVSTNSSAEYVKDVFSLEGLVRETVAELAGHTDMEGKHVGVHVGEGTWDVVANYLDIKRVIQNLLLNGGQASPQGTRIDIVLSAEGGNARMSVTDQGKGIPEEIQPLLMQHRYTSKPSGTGFGLLSCRQIIEIQHHGKLWFEPGEAGGAVFSFTLPLANRGPERS